MTNVVVWNLRDFGSGNNDYNTIRKNLIAALILDLNADVVVIQELKKNGVELLPQVTAILNKLSTSKWSFDWIVCGLPTEQSFMNTKDVKFGNLIFEKVSNSEGYAVLWRGQSIPKTKNKRSGGIGSTDISRSSKSKGSAIDLALDGYEVTITTNLMKLNNDIDSVPFTWGTDKSTGVMPFVAPDSWRALEQVGPDHSEYNPNTNGVKANKILSNSVNTRRPAKIVVNDQNGNPASVYVLHAPNAQYPAYYAPALMATIPDDNKTIIIAGDWNTYQSAGYGYLETFLFSNNGPSFQIATLQNGYRANTSIHFSTCYLDYYRWNSELTQTVFVNNQNQNITFQIATSARDYIAANFPFDNQYAPNYLNFVGYLQNNSQFRNTLGNLLGSIQNYYQSLINNAPPKAFQNNESQYYATTISAQGNYNLYQDTGYTEFDLFNLLMNNFAQIAPTNDPIRANALNPKNTGNPVADITTAFAIIYNGFVSDHLPVSFQV